MSGKKLLEEALEFNVEKRALEDEKRLKAYRTVELEGISMIEVFLN